jgi:hypothetical protein
MFKILDITKENVFALKVTGKVKAEDYDHIIPLLDKMTREYDSLRCLADLSALDGVKPDAFWKDFLFSIKHASKFEKVAIVGASPLIEGLSKLSSPLTKAEVKTFDEEEIMAATNWIHA